jgi:adenylate cyclase
LCTVTDILFQYLKQLGGFSTVLAALEQATRIDPNLLVHALSLMNGTMQQQQT